jgi:hypothetical protein
MSDSQPPLESAEAFTAFCERIRQKLHNHVAERIAFLESAYSDLSALETLARNTSNYTLAGELANFARQAQREIALLRGAARPMEAGQEISTLGVPVSASSKAFGEARLLENDALPAVEARPQIRPAPSRPPQVVPPVPPMPRRPLEEIYREVDARTEEAEQESPAFEGTPGLIRLKALLCRQRALQAELAAQEIEHWPLRQLLNYLRRRIDDEHGPGHYLIPLRAELWRVEAWPWQQLADLYEGLAAAYEALDWYDEAAERLNHPERQELLESIAAHQTRLWRHLQTYFPRQNDEHQINLFRDLCAIAEEEDIYLFSLQERCPDDVLAERTEELPLILEQLRVDRETRARREAVLQSLRALISDPDFGTRETDPQALSEAVARCRAEGLPASSIALRSLLMDWVALLEDSKDRSVQEVARELQRETERRQARKIEAENGDAERPLSENEQAELDAVLAVVRGKRCLFIGGICREESRQRIERELELAELVWPSTNGTESVYKFEPDIQSTDLTVILVRFMRTGWGQARELAVRHGKMFVRLPAGYGLMQVVRQFHRQLVREEPSVPAK